MTKQFMTAGLYTLFLSAAVGLGGCQSDKSTATPRPTGSVPNAATNDQGDQLTPPIIHFNQSDPH